MVRTKRSIIACINKNRDSIIIAGYRFENAGIIIVNVVIYNGWEERDVRLPFEYRTIVLIGHLLLMTKVMNSVDTIGCNW